MGGVEEVLMNPRHPYTQMLKNLYLKLTPRKDGRKG